MSSDLADEFTTDLYTLRFTQDHVKRVTVEAKKWILHLQGKYGEGWRAHASELRGVSQEVISEVVKIDLELPIYVAEGTGFYVVRNGVNTSYAWKEMGCTRIRAKLDINPLSGKEKLYRFEELRVE